ncbi:acetyltransferase [Aureobasidium pullulans]|uniref:Acetyltransferase n=1 Tax=Aureobasidium pullulans TaxID=5580 RepID=A0A4S9D711_AURPU|nr:acetyltransferase [Aureobasidium pullulans]
MSTNREKSSFSIQPATTAEDLLEITDLFTAYAESLNIDLSFQDFTTELSNLPGKYSPPNGVLLLARNDNGRAIGCVGLRPLDDEEVCEMKRLYVTPEGRGTGLGKALVKEVIQKAKAMGYQVMRLDTLASMEAAKALYMGLGFVERKAYYDTPIEGTVFFELDLKAI